MGNEEFANAFKARKDRLAYRKLVRTATSNERRETSNHQPQKFISKILKNFLGAVFGSKCVDTMR
jgi:hypothetical protein